GAYVDVQHGMYTMLGGVVLDRDRPEFPDQYGFYADPRAAPAQIPPMYLDWSIIWHGLGYASWGTICFWNGTCGHDPNQMDFQSRSVLKCGMLKFPSYGDIYVGRDGTVIQGACSYRWYPRLLK